jgi:hypothetical protein
VNENRWKIMSVTEIVLGVASVIPVFAPVAGALLLAGALLSTESTIHDCQIGATNDCIFNGSSIALGFGGSALDGVAKNARIASDVALAGRGFFKPVIKSIYYGLKSITAGAASYANNGGSLITSGLSNLPCNSPRQAGC